MKTFNCRNCRFYFVFPFVVHWWVRFLGSFLFLILTSSHSLVLFIRPCQCWCPWSNFKATVVTVTLFQDHNGITVKQWKLRFSACSHPIKFICLVITRYEQKRAHIDVDPRHVACVQWRSLMRILPRQKHERGLFLGHLLKYMGKISPTFHDGNIYT